MILAPNVELREYNKCHDPANGRFSTRTAGRCVDGAAEDRKKAADHLRQVRAIARSGRGILLDGGILRDAKARVSARKALRSLPGHLQPDARRALKHDRATVVLAAPVAMNGERGSHANALHRIAVLDQNDRVFSGGSRKVQQLTVLRHELGHITPDALSRTGRLVGTSVEELTNAVTKWTQRQLDNGYIPQWERLPADKQQQRVRNEAAARVDLYLEEVRAWRNAIRASGGRVSHRTIKNALGSYAAVALGAKGGQGYEGYRSKGDRLHEGVLAHLKRYARALRRRPREIAESSFLREYNKCHDPASGRFASPRDTPCGEPGELATHIPRGLPVLSDDAPPNAVGMRHAYTRVFNDATGGYEKRLHYTNVYTSAGGVTQLKGEILDQKALEGKILFHVTTDLDGVLRSGKLIARQSGGGLGGGGHAAVSFTADRHHALNILDTLTNVGRVIKDADEAESDESAIAALERHLREWSGAELRQLAAKKYPLLPGDTHYLDRVPMRTLDGVHNGIAETVRHYKAYLGDRGSYRTRASAAMNALRVWLWHRDSAGLGQNPVIFTGADKMRGKTFGLLAVPTRNIPRQTLVNKGADAFQAEVEVHGDVPIRGAYYLRGRRRR